MEGTILNKRKTGTFYENAAAEYLEERGYRILERNYQNRYGELDLIAIEVPEGAEALSTEEIFWRFEPRLSICEVKYRRTGECGDPAEAVTKNKMRHICRVTIGFYLDHHLMDDHPCRFDVITVQGDGRIRHIQDAFSFVF